MLIEIVKKYKNWKKGDKPEVTNDFGRQLIEDGFAKGPLTRVGRDFVVFEEDGKQVAKQSRPKPPKDDE